MSFALRYDVRPSIIIAVLHPVFSGPINYSIVKSHVPIAGTIVQKGSKVSVQMELESGFTTVPSIMGLSMPMAQREIESNELVAHFVGPTIGSIVTNVTPPEGTVVRRHSLVNVKLTLLERPH